MKNELTIDIPEVITKEDIESTLQKVGVKGLDREKVKELGVFQRLSYLICAMHSLIAVAYKIYGSVDSLFDLMGIKRHSIKQACNRFETEYERWEHFWHEYQSDKGMQEMNKDVQDLYKQFMRWAGLPLQWNLGDEQRAKENTEPLIEIPLEDRILRLYRDAAEKETEIIEETWAVMMSDPDSEGFKQLQSVECNLDKATAQMVAKRMSAEDHTKLYTACMVQQIKETRTEVVPYKAFMDGVTKGDIKKVRR